MPPLEFLNHSRGEVDLLVPRLKLCENSLLKMEKRPNVERSRSDCPSHCIESPDETCILASSELVLCIEPKSVEALAKQTLSLGPRDQELHLDTVCLSAESFDRLGRVDLDLLWMNG